MNVKNVMGMLLPKIKRKRIDLKLTTYNLKLTPFLTAHAHRSTGRPVLILASYVLILTTLFVCPAAAQTPEQSGAAQGQLLSNEQLPTNIQQLNIGDTIPEALWHLPLQVVNHPPTGGKDTITFNDYRGKAIILDVWSIANCNLILIKK
ncbi:hypothetical protein [Olivibacter sitiensis]|uniref:hypothetical protein n=1 Tax=Olivibacter sitiensis TaxID=376470 RepID=UPI0012F9AE4A|nr:hypothetical protein [Olivibacter sitiensis]